MPCDSLFSHTYPLAHAPLLVLSLAVAAKASPLAMASPMPQPIFVKCVSGRRSINKGRVTELHVQGQAYLLAALRFVCIRRACHVDHVSFVTIDHDRRL